MLMRGAAVTLMLLILAGEAGALTSEDRRSSRPTAQDEEEEGRVSIGVFYERASPVDELFPGARRGRYTLLIKGMNWTFLNNRWNDLYFDRKKKGDEFRAILQSDRGLDFTLFDKLCRWNKRDCFKVVVFDQGYLVISPESQAHKIVVPIPQTIAVKLEQFLKPDAPPPKED